MTDKQIVEYLDKGFSRSVINQTIDFLKQNNGELFNLAIIDQNTFRIMWKDLKTKRVEAKLFPIL
ncbi:MAG: hypothetical protein AABY22_19450 [Nanoarchaeota archaeon]